MLNDTSMGLAAAIIVISSIGWVTQWRKIKQKIKVRRAQHDATKPAL